MSRAVVALAALLLVPLLASLAMADHTYSHRYAIVGRLVDADGAPVEGAHVSVTGRLPATDTCVVQPNSDTDAWNATVQATTDARGEFRLCFHAHEIHQPTGEVTVHAASIEGEPLANATVAVDVDFRLAFVTLVAEAASGGAGRHEHLVAGRLWSPWAPGEPLDNVPVNGLALVNVAVEVRVAHANGTARATTTTNAYGDFAVRVPVPSAADVRAVEVRARNESFEQPAEARAGWTGMKLVFPPVAEFVLIANVVEGERVWHTPRNDVAPTLRVLAGARVTIAVVNAVDEPRAFQVEGHRSSDVLPARGDFVMYNFTAPEGGGLRYVDPVHPASNGRIVVVSRDGEPLPAPTPEAPPAPPSPPPTPTATDPPTATVTPTPTGERTPLPAVVAIGALALAAAFARRP